VWKQKLWTHNPVLGLGWVGFHPKSDFLDGALVGVGSLKPINMSKELVEISGFTNLCCDGDTLQRVCFLEGKGLQAGFRKAKREKKHIWTKLLNGIWVVGDMENSFSHHKRKGVDVSQRPPNKKKGDVMWIHGVINTPLVLGENAPSTSRQGTHVVHPLDFMIKLVLHNSFSWIFQSYMLKFDVSLWASLLNTNNFACFLLHHLNQPIWNEMISKQTYIWDSLCYNK